jgi:hypothetical protein
VESLLHTSCDKTQILWSELSLHIYRKTSDRVGFNVSNIILGEIPMSIDNKAMNFVILYVKQYNFICLMQKKEPFKVKISCREICCNTKNLKCTTLTNDG